MAGLVTQPLALLHICAWLLLLPKGRLQLIERYLLPIGLAACDKLDKEHMAHRVPS